MGTAINHGSNNDRNIIVQAEYDRAGRVVSLRDPRGNLSTFEYDRLDRRTKRTRGDKEWLTSYEDLVNGHTRSVTTMPGLTSTTPYDVVREFDRLGRTLEIDYNDAATTPRIAFEYDLAGQRSAMREYDATQQIRKTIYGYDATQRLTSVGFDTDGDNTAEETINYEYDLNGNRTRITLPGNQSVTYHYDAHGQLVELTDWDGQSSSFLYDKVGRHVGTQRHNGLGSDYVYDSAGNLRRIRHFAGSPQNLRAQFYYEVDGQGNRTQAVERTVQSNTVTETLLRNSPDVSYTAGTWTNQGDFKRSAQFNAKMETSLKGGDEGLLTMGTGPDHSIIDIYINGSLWQSYDCYTPDSGERVIHIPMDGTLEVRNRAVRNIHSNGYAVRFKKLTILEVTYNERTIQYTYDALSRLLVADTNSGERTYEYSYDRAGNRLMEKLTGTEQGLTPFTTNYIYNTLNQLISDGTNTFTYDPNGNLTHDGTSSYTWNRANRMLSVGNHSYAYDGLGNRISKTVGSTVTQYLLDVQPGLTKVLSETIGSNTQLYLHGPRGIHAQQTSANNWHFMFTDGLGSVREIANEMMLIIDSARYSPYGVPEVTQTTTSMGFTGEQTDANGQLYLRARYYNPNIGIFPALDPFEGEMTRPMSLNGYSWVEGNVVNMVDPSGLNAKTCDLQGKNVNDFNADTCVSNCRSKYGGLYDLRPLVNECIDDCIRTASKYTASRWNRIASEDCKQLGLEGSQCTTNFSDEGFAAMIYTIYAAEKPVEWFAEEKEFIGDIVYDLGIDRNRSLGIANIKLDVPLQIFKSTIPEYLHHGQSAGPYNTLATLTQIFERSPLKNEWETYLKDNAIANYDAAGAFVRRYDVSIELVAANINRGILLSRAIGTDPSVFNMAVWHNKGRVNAYSELAEEEYKVAKSHGNKAIQLMLQYYPQLQHGIDFWLYNTEDIGYLTPDTVRTLR